MKLIFIQKRKSSLFEPPFGSLRGNVSTSFIARWKTRVRLPIRHKWIFFTSSYCWDVTGWKLSSWAIFEGGGSLRSPILGGRGRRPSTTVGCQKTRRIALSCGIKNIAGKFFGLVTKHACDRRIGGRTYGQNYDSQDRASIDASRGKNGNWLPIERSFGNVSIYNHCGVMAAWSRN